MSQTVDPDVLRQQCELASIRGERMTLEPGVVLELLSAFDRVEEIESDWIPPDVHASEMIGLQRDNESLEAEVKALQAEIAKLESDDA